MRVAKTGKAAGKVDPETRARQQRCLDLVVRGNFTYAEIAEREGYAGESGARAAVEAALKRAANEAAEIVRPTMIARAEALWAKAYGAVLRAEGRAEFAEDSDELIKALNAADKALARLSKLYGLDAPDIAVNLGGDPAELERLRADVTRMLEGSAGVVDGEVVDSSVE